jgi:hypothetical protein
MGMHKKYSQNHHSTLEQIFSRQMFTAFNLFRRLYRLALYTDLSTDDLAEGLEQLLQLLIIQVVSEVLDVHVVELAQLVS